MQRDKQAPYFNSVEIPTLCSFISLFETIHRWILHRVTHVITSLMFPLSLPPTSRTVSQWSPTLLEAELGDPHAAVFLNFSGRVPYQPVQCSDKTELCKTVIYLPDLTIQSTCLHDVYIQLEEHARHGKDLKNWNWRTEYTLLQLKPMHRTPKSLNKWIRESQNKAQHYKNRWTDLFLGE